MGTGKTLSGVKYCVDYAKYGIKIYSNIDLYDIPNYELITLQDLIDYTNEEKNFDNCILFIDEIGSIGMDSRNSGSKRNIILSHFIILARKLGIVHFIYTSQFIHQVDKRLRSNTDILIKASKREFRGQLYISNLLMIMTEFGYKTKRFTFHANPYFKYYKTRQLIKLENVEVKKNIYSKTNTDEIKKVEVKSV